MTQWNPDEDGEALVYDASTASMVMRRVDVRRAVQTVADATDEFDIDMGTYGVVDVTLTESSTFTVSGAVDGEMWTTLVIVRQSGAGEFTVTWPTTTLFAGGPPTLTTAATGVDVVRLTTVDGGTTVYGETVGLAFADS